MKDYLKHHHLRITALSPIYVGSGSKIGKKEYIYMQWKNQVIIPDILRMHKELYTRHRAEYTKYMMWNGKTTLTSWLKNLGYKEADYRRWAAYILDAGDVLMSDDKYKEKRPAEILPFMKDAYDLPYVPGSTLKGLIRTALLAYEVTRNEGKYEKEIQAINNNSTRSASRRWYLNNETSALESKVFNTLARKPERKSDAVNSNMSGLIVSDSKPIGLDCLTLCQKLDYHIDGYARYLPLFYESLRPGTEIEFDITIDETLCPYTIQDIMDAIDVFQEICYKQFYSRFKRGTNKKGTIWLGGNTGFVTKTVIYPIMKNKGYVVADNVLRATVGKNYKTHKHEQNRSIKLAPHICKCTYYNNELYDMGMGMIEVID